MGVVTIEEGDEERSIVTPDLRLRFRWTGDRWTHALDVRPGPWRTVADAVEWSSPDRASAPGPTYQEVHFQADGDDVLAMTVGQAGPHHFSASFRVRYRAYRQPHFQDPTIVQDRSESRVEIDVADRCRSDSAALEARYLVHSPPVSIHLGDSEDPEASDGFSRRWRSGLAWEVDVENGYHVAIETSQGPSASRMAILDRIPPGDWLVKAAPSNFAPGGTNRFVYAWGLARVHAFPSIPDPKGEPVWTLKGAPDPLGRPSSSS